MGRLVHKILKNFLYQTSKQPENLRLTATTTATFMAVLACQGNNYVLKNLCTETWTPGVNIPIHQLVSFVTNEDDRGQHYHTQLSTVSVSI